MALCFSISAGEETRKAISEWNDFQKPEGIRHLSMKGYKLFYVQIPFSREQSYCSCSIARFLHSLLCVLAVPAE
jgi:hypothetical protein